MSRRKEVWRERDLPQSTDPEDRAGGVGIWREGGPRGCSCKCLGRGRVSGHCEASGSSPQDMGGACCPGWGGHVTRRASGAASACREPAGLSSM